jgi:hypothetical protein
MIYWDTYRYRTKRVDHMVSISSKSCHLLVWSSKSGFFAFTDPLNRLSCSKWSGERPTRIKEYPIVSQILKEHGVPGLHRPVGGEHIDFTRGIKVICVCIDDGGKVAFSIMFDKTTVVSKMANESTSLGLASEGGSLFMPGNRTEGNHRK